MDVLTRLVLSLMLSAALTLTSLTVAGVLETAPPQEPVDVEDAGELYQNWNKRYWDGALPKLPIRTVDNFQGRPGTLGLLKMWTETVPRDEAAACIEYDSGGRVCYADASLDAIVLRADLEGSRLRGVLLHEMVHVYLYVVEDRVGHGPKFIREARRVGIESLYITRNGLDGGDVIRRDSP